jgi:hypothetical protein
MYTAAPNTRASICLYHIKSHSILEGEQEDQSCSSRQQDETFSILSLHAVEVQASSLLSLNDQSVQRQKIPMPQNPSEGISRAVLTMNAKTIKRDTLKSWCRAYKKKIQHIPK